MQEWEYHTQFMFARVDREFREMMPPDVDLAKFAPQTMIPELNELGSQGWELVHMEPVFVGRNDDVLIHDSESDGRQWSNGYFCVFKRPFNG